MNTHQFTTEELQLLNVTLKNHLNILCVELFSDKAQEDSERHNLIETQIKRTNELIKKVTQ